MAESLWPETEGPLVRPEEFTARPLAAVRPLVQYQRDPVAFLVERLGIDAATITWGTHPAYATHEWDGTTEPLVAMLAGLRDGQDVGVEAGTGTQKSFTAAAIILWFLASFPDARVFTFAPKADQLKLFIWKEVRTLWPAFARMFPTATLTDLCVRVRGGLDDGWAARGYAVDVRAGESVSTHAQGMHAEHMLLIYEECPGIEQATIEAGKNTCTGPHNLRLFLGNPDHQLDTLHRACIAPGVRHIRVSALDHPNVVTGETIVPGGAVSRKSVDARRAEYGVNSRLFQSRVRGLSPAESTEALIKLEWVQRAQQRWRDAKANGTFDKWGLAALGVDVANSLGGDEGAIARFRGRLCREVESFPCPDANALGRRVVTEMKDDAIADQHVGIDSVGVGAGTVNECHRLGRWIRSLNGGASPVYESDHETYNNLRSQMLWRAREDLRLNLVDLPPDHELSVDLTTPEYETRNGKIIVESKEEIKKRLPGGRSTNKGDAFIYGNFVRDRDPIASNLSPPEGIRHGDPSFGERWTDTNPVDTDAMGGAHVEGGMRSRMGAGW